MPRLEWDEVSNRPYTAGVHKGVAYFDTTRPEVWNGLVSVTEKNEDTEIYAAYFDGRKYAQTRTPDGITVAIEAFTYPDAFDEYDTLTGMSWQVLTATSYEVHILYNVRLTVQDATFVTVNNEVEPLLFQWEGSTVPVCSSTLRCTSHVTIVGDLANENVLDRVEDILYGTDETEPRLPTLDELIDIFENYKVFIIIDHGDGTWSAIGPDDWFTMITDTHFKIVTPSAYYLDRDTYRVSSW